MPTNKATYVGAVNAAISNPQFTTVSIADRATVDSAHDSTHVRSIKSTKQCPYIAAYFKANT